MTGAHLIRRVVPDRATADIDGERDFFADVVGMQVAMDQGWVVTLVSPTNPTAQVTLLTREATASVIPDMSIEVDDVDAVHDRAVGAGREIVHPLTDESWGVRRFFVRSPDGTIVNILSHGDS